MTQTVLLGGVVQINPTTTLKKGTDSKFVSMDKLEPFKRKISSYEEREYKGGSKFMNGDTLLARITPCLENGKTAFVDILGDDEVGAGSTEFVVLRAIEGVTDPNYMYYLSISPEFRNFAIQAMIGTSGRQRVQNDVLARYEFELPGIKIQQKIGEQLRTIDEKIELNRQMNETLEQMGQALFRHYFIDNPEAEKWDDGVLGDIIVNFDSKRKPVSSRQRAEMKGEYRYFGATSVMDYVNDYLFDGKYLLLAEDGSAIKSDGTPYLQYVWGKFWVNNHAHILQAKDPYTVEYLYLLLSQSNVQSLVSGAVQLKINQRAMNSFRVKLPPHNLVKEFCEKIDPMFAQRRKNEDEIQTLTTLRDTLLPRLINGKVKL